MSTKLIASAVLTAFATTVAAAPFEASYALTAVHADFQSQLEQTATAGGAIGTAARTAADLMSPHNAAQERLVLPTLRFADLARAGELTNVPQWSAHMKALDAEMPQLFDSDVNLITALVELYALADEAGQADIARMAERMIWHEVNDTDVLYPAAYLIGATVQN